MTSASKVPKAGTMMRKSLLVFGDFVFEHAQIFRRFMRDCWVAGLTISGWKMSIGMPSIDIVGFSCDQGGQRPEPKKVQWILDWPVPKTLKNAHTFIGIVIYYHIFILNFAI